MENPIRKRQAIEDFWRERQQSALALYRAAKIVTGDAQAGHRDSLTPAPDGSFAFSHALKAENAALREYCRVLKIFTDLVVHDKMPPDDAK